MYGEQAHAATPVSADLAAIDVALIPDRTGQQLRNQLEQLLDPAGAASVPDRYTLSVQLREKVDTFAVERSGFATRANIELIAAYSLQENSGGTRVLAGSTRTISAYNLLDNDFSTVVAADDARNRAVQQLAYEIRNRLAAHFSTAPQSVGGSPNVAPLPTLQEGSDKFAPPATEAPFVRTGG
jgi:LPS-assembly lipoprotein